MRYKEPFTIYPRKLKKITVYYYQCYDAKGKRICGHSTGQRTKTAAIHYCMELYRKGALIPDYKPLYFAQFAKGWWDPKMCKYLEWRQLQNPLSPSTIDHYKANLELHIQPFFGKMKMSDITQETVQNWIMGLSQKGYTNSSINIQIATLKVMMKEAVRVKLIVTNPMEKVKKLIAHNKEVQILKNEEVHNLFHCNWHNIWDSYDIYMLNKLAACTGMRISEIIGLQSEHIHPDHIHVCVQYSKKYGLRPLKTKDSRNIPITPFLHNELMNLIGQNKGYIFSLSNGTEPIAHNKVYKETRKAFEKIGISREEQKSRRIAVHHWRHFLNTALLMANISTLKVQKITGHKSLSMTMHYTHFDSREFTEVIDVQNNLLASKE
jgi:site-specific recombinase XerD